MLWRLRFHLYPTPVEGGVDSLDYTCTSQGTLPIVGVVAEIMVVKENLNLETTAPARAVIRVVIISNSNPIIISC